MKLRHPIVRIVLLGYFLPVFCAHSQNFIGIASQTNGSFYSAYQNPSLLVNNHYKFQLHVVSMGMHIDNNYVRYAAPFSMFDLLQGKNSRSLEPYDLEEIRNDKRKNGTIAAEVRGPALAVRLGGKTHMAVMSRLRSGFQVSDASERLMAIARLGMANADNLQNLGYLALHASQSENRFSLASQAYSEWAFTLGQTLSETDDARLKGGFTIKRYFGYAGGYVQNRSLNYKLLPDTSTVNGAYMQVDQLDASMGYTDVKIRAIPSLGWLLGQNANGKGWGWDVGLTYERLGDNKDQSPVLRLSASLTDMGQINYTGNAVRNYDIKAEDRQITEEEWRGYSSPREGENQLSAFGRLLEEEFDLGGDKNTGSFTIATPTALNLNIDFQLMNKIFIHATRIQGIRRTDLPQWRQTSLWAVTPRYESDKVGIAFPLIRQNGAWAVGTGLRVGPIVAGSDNLLGIFSRNGRFKSQGVDVYAGLSFSMQDTGLLQSRRK